MSKATFEDISFYILGIWTDTKQRRPETLSVLVQLPGLRRVGGFSRVTKATITSINNELHNRGLYLSRHDTDTYMVAQLPTRLNAIGR